MLRDTCYISHECVSHSCGGIGPQQASVQHYCHSAEAGVLVERGWARPSSEVFM